MPQARATPTSSTAVLGVARLHAGLGVTAVVEHRDRQVGRPLHADRRQRAQPHQHLAVAGDDQHRRSGRAIARPSPTIAAAPIAPHR